jgi:hypothetical protein
MYIRATPRDAVQQHGRHLVTTLAGPTPAGTPGSGSTAAAWPIPSQLIYILMKVAVDEMKRDRQYSG